MMKKTITRWAAAILMLGSMIPLSAAEQFITNGIKYEYLDSYTVKVVENNNCPYSGDIVIPDYVNYAGLKLKVITIGTSAFSECEITSVKLPKTLRTIEKQSFDRSTIKEVIIPYGVENIGESAFANCKHLERAVLQASLETIGQSAFAKCTKLSELVLLMDFVPQGLDKQIDVFGGPEVLENLTVYTTVKGLEAWQKFQPSGSSQPLKFVKLYEVKVDRIVYEVISGALMTARVGWNNTVENEAVIRERLLLNDSEYTVTEIKYDAFRQNFSLFKLELPATIEKVGEKAFRHTTHLVELILLAETPPAFDNEEDPFYPSVYKNCTLRVPTGCSYAYGRAIGWGKFENIVDKDSGINEETANYVQAYAAEGAVSVKGVAEGMLVSVYDVLGSLVTQGFAEGEEIRLDVPQKGIYMVRAGGRCCKVLVK